MPLYARAQTHLRVASNYHQGHSRPSHGRSAVPASLVGVRRLELSAGRTETEGTSTPPPLLSDAVAAHPASPVLPFTWLGAAVSPASPGGAAPPIVAASPSFTGTLMVFAGTDLGADAGRPFAAGVAGAGAPRSGPPPDTLCGVSAACGPPPALGPLPPDGGGVAGGAGGAPSVRPCCEGSAWPRCIGAGFVPDGGGPGRAGVCFAPLLAGRGAGDAPLAAPAACRTASTSLTMAYNPLYDAEAWLQLYRPQSLSRHVPPGMMTRELVHELLGYADAVHHCTQERSDICGRLSKLCQTASDK